MDTTTVIICTLILMVGSGIGGWYWHKQQSKKLVSILLEDIQKLEAKLALWVDPEGSMKAQYTPEVIGEYIVREEDIPSAEEIDKMWANQQWREEQQRQCAKDIDRRIPGQHQP